MTKFKTVTRDGWHWLVCDWGDGRRVWLYKQARVGQCFAPGQRSRHG